MNRGPKPKTAKNKPSKPTGPSLAGPPVPTCTLTPIAQTEFERLVLMLDNRNTLERVDVAVITEAARVFARLCKAYDDDDTKVINQLTTQRRGLLRELGLTLQPSRTLVKTVAKDPNAPTEATKPFIKLA
jgi:phage terminase small subunit